MRDPIDELSNLDTGADVNPPPPSEIRRRGDRLRRRNHLLAGAGAAAVVALIVAPLAVLGVPRADDGPDPAPPTPTQTPTDTTLSEANLMTDADTEYDGQARWLAGETRAGESDPSFNPCLRSPMAELGAEAVFERGWGLEAHGLSQTIAEFASPDDARTAYEQVLGWQGMGDDGCTPPGSDGYKAGEPTSVRLPVEGEARVVESAFIVTDAQEGGESFGAHRMITGIAVSDDRLTVLTHDMPDADYDWGETSPVERMLPAAAERLAMDTAVDEPAAVTRIPDGFPLTSGMPDGSGEGERFFAPGRDLESMSATGAELYACGSSPSAGDLTDRLTTRITGPANGHVRELQLFADDAAAEAWVDTLRSHYEACPEDSQNGSPPFVSTTVRDGAIGEESVDIRRSFDDAGRVAITVVRVGNAVLVENVSDEGSDVGALATMARENLADVVAAMSDLVEGGSGDTSPPASDGSSAPTRSRLGDRDLLTADQIPDDGGAPGRYREIPPYEGATLACQADWLDSLGAEQLVSREFGAWWEVPQDQVDPTTTPSGQINTAVLRFADADSAGAAYDTVQGWVSACEPRVDDTWDEADTTSVGSEEREVGAAERAEWVRGSFRCNERTCGVWFARMAYAQIGDRLLVLQVQELFPPGQPEPGVNDPMTRVLDRGMDDLVRAAIRRAAP